MTTEQDKALEAPPVGGTWKRVYLFVLLSQTAFILAMVFFAEVVS